MPVGVGVPATVTLTESTSAVLMDDCDGVTVTVGVETIVYVADTTALVAYPLATAMAWMVFVAETDIAPEYGAEAVVGALPSVV